MRRDRRSALSCRDGEFYDAVVSRCSLCRDVCGPAVDHTFCIKNCPDYYRQYVQPSVTPLSHVTIASLTSSASALVAVDDQLITKPLFWTSVVSMIVAVLASVAIVFLCVIRRRGESSRAGRCHGRRAPLLPASVTEQGTGALAGLNVDGCNRRDDDDSYSGDGLISLRSVNGLELIGSYGNVGASERTLPGGNTASCGGTRGGRQLSHSTATGSSHLERSKDAIYSLSSSFCHPDNLLPVGHVTSSCEMSRLPTFTGEIPRREQSLVGKYSGEDNSGVDFSCPSSRNFWYSNNLLLQLEPRDKFYNEFAKHNNNSNNISSLYVHQTECYEYKPTKNCSTPDKRRTSNTSTSRLQLLSQLQAAVHKTPAAAAAAAGRRRPNINASVEGETMLKHRVVDAEDADSFSSKYQQQRVDFGHVFTAVDLPTALSSRHSDYGVTLRSRLTELQPTANVFDVC